MGTRVGHHPAGPGEGGTPAVLRRPTLRSGRASRRLLAPSAMLILAVTLLATGCVPDLTPRPTPTPRRYTGDTGPPLTPASGVPGDPTAGRRLFVSTGCAGCHTLRGVPTATGVAGPNLTNVALRPTLAGETIPMAPETLTAFLLEPAAVKPGTPMPNVGLTPEQAADITAFLYSQPYRPGP